MTLWSNSRSQPLDDSGRMVGKPYLTGLGKSSPSTGPDATLHERIFAQRVCTDIPRWLQSKILDHPNIAFGCRSWDGNVLPVARRNRPGGLEVFHAPERGGIAPQVHI